MSLRIGRILIFGGPGLLLAAVVGLCQVMSSAAASLEAGSGVSEVSVSAAGSSHAPIWSADGRSIAFVSLARNLATNEVAGRSFDVYVRDLLTGNITLVSVNVSGAGGNDHSFMPSPSSKGLVIAFESEASDLAGADHNRASDIYVRDLAAGVTRLVSVAADGSGSGNGPSRHPLLSQDGRFVVFESLASNLVTNDFNSTNDVFIHELHTGVTSLVSVNADGTASADGPSESASVSADGGIVAFVSRGTNLASGVKHRLGEVYVRRVQEQTTLWLGVAHLRAMRDVAPAQGADPIITRDGRFVAFKTSASGVARWDLSGPSKRIWQLFPLGGGVRVTNAFVFEDNPRYRVLPAPWGDLPLTLSEDGRYGVVALAPGNLPVEPAATSSPGLSPGLSFSRETLQRVDFETFETFVEIRRSDPLGYVTNQIPILRRLVTALGSTFWTNRPFLHYDASMDGSRVMFLSDLTGFDSNVVVDSAQIFLQDVSVAAPTPRVVSTNRLGRLGLNLASVLPALSPDGRWVAYESSDVLVPGDLNNTSDVYVRDLPTGEPTLISARGASRSSAVFVGPSSIRPNCVSADGRWLVLTTADRQSTDYDPKPIQFVWLRDLAMGSNHLLHPADRMFSRDAVMSADGRFVAFLQWDLANYQAQVVRLDRESGQRMAMDSRVGQRLLSVGVARDRMPYTDLSRDGRLVAYLESPSGRLVVRDFARETNLIVNVDSAGNVRDGEHWLPVFSRDNRWLAFVSTATLTTNGLSGLHVRDLAEGRTFWLDDGLGSITLTNSFAFSADSRFITFVRGTRVILRSLVDQTERVVTPDGRNPAVSGNGRYVVCETPSGGSEPRQIVRFDLVASETNLISRGRTSTAVGGNRHSAEPVISADGRFVVFASKAGDLVADDTNGQSDVFVLDTVLGTTLLASLNARGTGSGNGPSLRPVLGADDRTVIFESFASDLMDGDHNERRDVYLLRLGGADTDGDGLDDDWEQAYFSSLERDGFDDFDGDGLRDRDEFLAGTAPIDGSSILRVITVSGVGGGGTKVLWSAIPGRSYRVQFKSDLEGERWEYLPGIVTATSETASALDTEASAPHRFYRVLIAP